MSIIDPVSLGKVIAYERGYHGFDTREEFANALAGITGDRFTKRMIGSIERGEINITYDTMLAILMLVPGFDMSRIRDAVREEHRTAFDKLMPKDS